MLPLRIGRRAVLALSLCLATGAGAPPQTGVASWYGRPFHGRKMANGKAFDMWSRSAAHRTLPLGTKARVTNLLNGRSEEVSIDDRGPFLGGRLLDVSAGTAKRLGFYDRGLAPVLLVPHKARGK